jgi:hypothetical protein
MNYDRPGFWGGISLLLIWSLIWKGLALWKSARNDERYWFVAFLLPINTAGILEMLYLFVFAKNKLVLVSEPVKPVKKTTRKK